MVEFSNKWYRETCTENGLNPDNELSKTAVDLARDRAIDMKKYMDAKKNYDDENLHKKFDKEISRLDNERIGHMLDALMYAEIMADLGDGFDTFSKQHLKKKNRLMGKVQNAQSLTPAEKRVSERWQGAMKKMKGREIDNS